MLTQFSLPREDNLSMKDTVADPKCSTIYIVSEVPLLIIIYYSAGATVGMEHTYYHIIESVDVVELCVTISLPVISCPIDFQFEAQLSTVDGTAGSWETFLLTNMIFFIFHSPKCRLFGTWCEIDIWSLWDTKVCQCEHSWWLSGWTQWVLHLPFEKDSWLGSQDWVRPHEWKDWYPWQWWWVSHKM